jgi:anti-anti-sigma factor
MLKIDRLEIGSVTVLRAEGEIDDASANTLREKVRNCMADKRYQIALDLSKVVYMSCMGAGALVECLGALQKCNGDMKLAGMNLQSRRLLSTMGLGHVFESYDSENSAVKGYQQEAA